MCGTIKDDIIEVNGNLTRLLAYSIYDTNPIYILKRFTEKIAWTTKKVKYGISIRRPLLTFIICVST